MFGGYRRVHSLQSLPGQPITALVWQERQTPERKQEVGRDEFMHEFCRNSLKSLDFYLLGQGIKGRGLSDIKATWGGSAAQVMGGGVGLDDDVSTMVSPSFGTFFEVELLSLNLLKNI